MECPEILRKAPKHLHWLFEKLFHNIEEQIQKVILFTSEALHQMICTGQLFTEYFQRYWPGKKSMFLISKFQSEWKVSYEDRLILRNWCNLGEGGNVLYNNLQIESKPYVAGIYLSNIVQQVTFFTIDRSAKKWSTKIYSVSESLMKAKEEKNNINQYDGNMSSIISANPEKESKKVPWRH